MTYATGGSTGPDDLLDKIRVFALANGWTVDLDAARTDVQANTVEATYEIFNANTPSAGSLVPGRSLLIHKGSCYAAIHTDNRTTDIRYAQNGPYMIVQTYPGPYSAGQTSVAQTGKSPGSVTNKLVGPFQAYHFFGGPAYIHVVVEIRPAEYRHFGFGIIDKAGAVTSGAYDTGTTWQQAESYVNSIESQWHAVPFDDISAGFNSSVNLGYNGTHIRCDSDGVSPRYAQMIGFSALPTNFAYNAAGGIVRNGGKHLGDCPLGGGLARVGVSTLTGRSMLIPMTVSVGRDSNFISLLGTFPDVRGINIANLNPNATVTLGPDTWRVFPISRKNGLPGQENSGVFGLAYRQLP